MELRGKVFFITGGAQGLGRAYAEAVLEQGAKVFLGDVNAAAGSSTLKEFAERFGEENVQFAVLDVTNFQQFKGVFDQAVSEFDHVDVLVNNAGIMNESNWELMVNINYTALIYGTKLATEHMRKDKGGRGGRIINISSLAGLNDYYFFPIYCGTKHAIRSFTSSLTQQPNIEELGVEYGVLCPNAVATDLILKMDEKNINFFQEVKSQIESSMMSISTVVDGFMELVQLPKMNGAILLVTLEGNTYRKLQPNIEQLGIEYGILSLDAAATDLVLKLDNDKMYCYDKVKDLIQAQTMQVSTVVDAFLELLQLDRMNGAILQINKDGKTYWKMENQAV